MKNKILKFIAVFLISMLLIGTMAACNKSNIKQISLNELFDKKEFICKNEAPTLTKIKDASLPDGIVFGSQSTPAFVMNTGCVVVKRTLDAKLGLFNIKENKIVAQPTYNDIKEWKHINGVALYCAKNSASKFGVINSLSSTVVPFGTIDLITDTSSLTLINKNTAMQNETIYRDSEIIAGTKVGYPSGAHMQTNSIKHIYKNYIVYKNTNGTLLSVVDKEGKCLYDGNENYQIFLPLSEKFAIAQRTKKLPQKNNAKNYIETQDKDIFLLETFLVDLETYKKKEIKLNYCLKDIIEYDFKEDYASAYNGATLFEACPIKDGIVNFETTSFVSMDNKAKITGYIDDLLPIAKISPTNYIAHSYSKNSLVILNDDMRIKADLHLPYDSKTMTFDFFDGYFRVVSNNIASYFKTDGTALLQNATSLGIYKNLTISSTYDISSIDTKTVVKNTELIGATNANSLTNYGIYITTDGKIYNYSRDEIKLGDITLSSTIKTQANKKVYGFEEKTYIFDENTNIYYIVE